MPESEAMTHHDVNAKTLLQSALKRSSHGGSGRAQAPQTAPAGGAPAKAGLPASSGAPLRRAPTALRAGRRF